MHNYLRPSAGGFGYWHPVSASDSIRIHKHTGVYDAVLTENLSQVVSNIIDHPCPYGQSGINGTWNFSEKFTNRKLTVNFKGNIIDIYLNDIVQNGSDRFDNCRSYEGA